jgi:hypothetical protein
MPTIKDETSKVPPQGTTTESCLLHLVLPYQGRLLSFVIGSSTPQGLLSSCIFVAASGDHEINRTVIRLDPLFPRYPRHPFHFLQYHGDFVAGMVRPSTHPVSEPIRRLSKKWSLSGFTIAPRCKLSTAFPCL